MTLMTTSRRPMEHRDQARHVLDGMMTVDFYSINRALRGSGSLDEQCGAYLDMEGWESRRQFAEATHFAFYDLWRAGALGTHAGETAYRGCTFSSMALDGMVHAGYLLDHGYGFATPWREEAEDHLHEDERSIKGIYPDGDETLVPVLFEIQIGQSSLYLPAKDEPDPCDLRAGFMIARQGGQFILERYSMLKFTKVTRGDVVQVLCQQRL